ncbi:MAG TPA: magnesium-translocating P-type ATPase [Lentisphaeria bacterium]|nr:MAG: magnesium-translocating P-type ATPase [Lentisphaerae bacterium GWF2_38_69]HBM15492.1 magnesium-translocating P-type ATPase [Lentisphaeria bacterium]
MFKFKQKKTTEEELRVHLDHVRNQLRVMSLLSIDKLMEKFETGDKGLKPERIEELLREYGKNIVGIQKPPPWWKILYYSFKTPFNMILFLLMLVSVVTGDKSGGTVMGAMILLSTFLRFWQESKAVMEAEYLKKLVHNKATVIRQLYEGKKLVCKEVDIPMENLVPGDIVHLSAGDMIPGDVRLISSRDLFVSQSALTGEALPVEKHENFKKFKRSVSLQKYIGEDKGKRETAEKTSSLDQPNMCLMGSSVVSGTAKAVVLCTGTNTFFGSMASQLIGKRPQTAFDQGVDSVGKLLVKFMFVMAPIVFIVNGFMKSDWTDAFLFAISVAVGLTPEMLPMILNANLARGAVALSKKKTVVKNLSSIQNFGAMDVLCTDKTGTLTQDKVVLIKHLDLSGEKSKSVLSYAFLNSHFQTGLKNLLDKAVITRAEDKQVIDIAKDYKLIDEIPFDFVRRRMSVILEKYDTKEKLFICKGAVEETIRSCTKIELHDGEIKDISEEYANVLNELKDQLSEDGLRVVVVAYKQITEWAEDKFSTEDEKDLIFSGYIAFLDPPKESTSKALKLLMELGIEVKVLTGDNDLVSRKICKDVELPVKGILTGPEIDQLDEIQLTEKVKNCTVFAKLSPANKARVVKNLKSQKHVVGFMGDGINDALALREADVGISVDTGTDLAKEAADIILLEKSLLVLEEGVREGRRTFGNIIKYIQMTCSSNFGNVFSVLIASAILPFLPMMPVQLLIQNLLYDFSQIAIPWDRMDEDFMKRPKTWDPKSIKKFMIFIGPISSIFDICTFAIMWYVFKANCDAQQALFNSGWFVEGLITQTLIVHMIRTEKIPFIQSRASFPVVFGTSLVILLGVLIPYAPFTAHLGFVPLPLSYFPYLVAMTIAYCLLTQLCKTWYIRKFKSWL